MMQQEELQQPWWIPGTLSFAPSGTCSWPYVSDLASKAASGTFQYSKLYSITCHLTVEVCSIVNV